MKLRQDSRDLHILDHFKGVSDIPDEKEFDVGLTNPIEARGGENCTAISGTDVCTDQTNVVFNVDDLWSLTPHGPDGADPRDSMATIIKYGLQPVSGGPRDTRWKKYFRAEGNKGDYFLTTQASMMSVGSSSTMNCNYYAEWNAVGHDGILPKGKTWVSGHSMKITGWKNNMMHVKHWRGYMVWMPREVFNIEMDMRGTSALIPVTIGVIIQSTRTLFQWIQDLLVNIGLSLKQSTLSASGYPPALYLAAKKALGTKQTLNDNIPADTGCAEAVSAIMKSAGISVPAGGIAGTSSLRDWLIKNPNFTQISQPELGCIIISATSSLGKISHGHVGIMAQYNLQYVDDWGIVSNDSDTGLVREKWSLKDWINYYQSYGGLDVQYFRYVG